MSFHLFRFSLISFKNTLQFSVCILQYLVKFIPKYFILCGFFLIHFWIILLAYGNTVDVCVLILYSANLLILFISSNSCLVDFLGFSMYQTMSSVTKDGFSSFFLVQMPFISFTCLITLTRNFITVLNKSDKSGHSVLFLIFGGKHSASPHLLEFFGRCSLSGWGSSSLFLVYERF